MKVAIAHDFICPWCYIGHRQARQLQRDFGVEIEWRGYELMPLSLDYDPPAEPKPVPEDKPPILSRLQFLCLLEGCPIPKVERPPQMRSYRAHQAAVHTRQLGVEDAFIDRVYEAYWHRGENINELSVLRELASGLMDDLDEFERAIEEDRYDQDVVDFDDDAYRSGVYNVPTFFIGSQRLAEQPYDVLRNALIAEHNLEPDAPIYRALTFPIRAERPFVFCNMVTTIDGKILTGERDEPVHDLGSKHDHAIMRRLEAKADAVLCGASSLRATPASWNPESDFRVVVSRSGRVPMDHGFLRHGRPILIVPAEASPDVPANVTVMKTGRGGVDFLDMMRQLKDMGIHVINLLGGSDLNGQLIALDLVDELFLTLAPKIKLGEDVPTYADGKPLPREKVQQYELTEQHRIGNELFLRYRRKEFIGSA